MFSHAKMDTPSPTQEHCPSCRSATSDAQAIACTALTESVEVIVALLELIAEKVGALEDIPEK